jgi:hypothetical protein
MNNAMEPENDSHISTTIDETLQSIGTATPASGLEGRILTRLASERIKMEAAPAKFPLLARLSGSSRNSARALGLVTASLLGFVIVAGSVSHSRKLHSSQIVAPPVLVLPSNGIGAASAVHPAAPASAPVPAGQSARGRSAHRSGRARIAPHSRKAPGVAVPAPSSNNSQN